MAEKAKKGKKAATHAADTEGHAMRDAKKAVAAKGKKDASKR